MEPRPVPNAVDPQAWAEACRRDDVIRVLVAHAKNGRVGRAVVKDAAASQYKLESRG